MLPQPKHLGPEYGAQFQDRSVVAAYSSRPPYPPEVFAALENLLGASPRVVLELGCGTGEIARGLAPCVDRIDAVDPSAEMLRIAGILPGSDSASLRWHHASAEEFSYPETYSLIVAAESLHWFDWQRAFPAMRGALREGGKLAIVERAARLPWKHELYEIIPRYSTNRDYEPYDLVEELAERGLFSREGSLTTPAVEVRQTIAGYVDSIHSRNGFSRDRMDPDRAGRFDREVMELLSRYKSRDGNVTYEASARIVWGVPTLPKETKH